MAVLLIAILGAIVELVHYSSNGWGPG